MNNFKVLNIKKNITKIVISGTIAILFLVVMFKLTKALAYSELFSNKNTNNSLSIQILNYSLPVVKVNNEYTFDTKKQDINLEQILFSILGFDINKPSTIISKEILCMNYAQNIDISDGKYNKTIDVFNLNDNEITRDTDSKNQTDSSNGNDTLPNHVVQVYNTSLKKTLNTSNPEVLIYHTHTTESYKDTNTNNMDPTKNVCAVGDELTNELQNNYGICVIHDKTVHDAYAYTSSYVRSGATLDKYLKKYKDFKLIIDMHRDSPVDWKYGTVKLNNSNTARFRFVMDKKNPHFSVNNNVAQSLTDLSNKFFPGLANSIYYYDGGNSYFNQNKSNNAVLIEVGSNINTLDEAKNTPKYLARIIAEYLKNKK